MSYALAPTVCLFQFFVPRIFANMYIAGYYPLPKSEECSIMINVKLRLFSWDFMWLGSLIDIQKFRLLLSVKYQMLLLHWLSRAGSFSLPSCADIDYSTGFVCILMYVRACKKSCNVGKIPRHEIIEVGKPLSKGVLNRLNCTGEAHRCTHSPSVQLHETSAWANLFIARASSSVYFLLS